MYITYMFSLRSLGAHVCDFMYMTTVVVHVVAVLLYNNVMQGDVITVVSSSSGSLFNIKIVEH